jgi:hypothetical protein
MKAVIICGVLFICFVVFLLGTMLPDTTEASLFNLLAGAAEKSKRSAMYNSVEVQSLLAEIEDLEAQLALIDGKCTPLLAEQPEGWRARVSGFLGDLF